MELSNVDQCAHKILRKQMSGMQVWYVCECGQKFKAVEWDGRIKVLSSTQQSTK